jgi:hypothetical protein
MLCGSRHQGSQPITEHLLTGQQQVLQEYMIQHRFHPLGPSALQFNKSETSRADLPELPHQDRSFVRVLVF